MLNTSLNKLQHDTLLERTRLTWSHEEGGRTFFSQRDLQICQEDEPRSLGGESKGVSFGECWTGYRYIQYIYMSSCPSLSRDDLVRLAPHTTPMIRYNNVKKELRWWWWEGGHGHWPHWRIHGGRWVLFN